MQSITDKIKNYINHLSYEEVVALVQSTNRETIQFNIGEDSVYRASLLVFITMGYEDAKNNMLTVGRQITKEIEENPTWLPVFSESKDVKIAHQFCCLVKYNRSDNLVSILKEKGITDDALFINLENLENIMLDIIKSGVVIRLIETLYLVDLIYNARVVKYVLNNFGKFEVSKTYDKRKNVRDIDIQLVNILRKRKYASKKPKAKDEFESLMNDLFDVLNAIPNGTGEEMASTLLLNSIRNHNSPCRDAIKEYFMNLSTNKTKAQIKKVFSQFFHILFENDINGLLSEDQFTTLSAFNGQYEYSYKRYYSTRLDTLAGFKGTKKYS